jgi:hypothetical protein
VESGVGAECEEVEIEGYFYFSDGLMRVVTRRLLNKKPRVSKMALCTGLSTTHSLDTRLYITLKVSLNEAFMVPAL